MTYRLTFDRYYAQLVNRRKSGYPMAREARIDYVEAISSSMPRL